MKPKKSLGQHFLKSDVALRAMISEAALSPRDTVLEVGPGRGTLTEALLATGARVIAVEKDERLAESLKSLRSIKSIKPERLKIICADILTFNFTDLTDFSDVMDYKLVANIPYYLTGALLRKFLESETRPSKMVLMVQKEVAERIVARDGKESILSMGVKKFARPTYVATVGKECFHPRPKVDSAVISLLSRETPLPIDLELVRRGFAHPRKLLSGNLGINPSDLKNNAIPEKARAENLSTEQWIQLCKYLHK